MNEYSLLIAEDERIVARDLKGSLEGMGYEVVEIVSSGEQAIESAGNNRPDLVLMDIVLKGEIDGVDASREIKERYDIPVVYLTAHTDLGTIERVKQTEPYGYIVKPFRIGELRSVIEIAIHKHGRSKRLKEESENIASVLGVVGSGVVTIDRGGIIRYLNPRAEEITGKERSKIIGSNVDGLLELCSEDEAGLEDMIMLAIENENGFGMYEEVGIKVDGEEKKVDIHVMRLDGEDGEVKGAALLFLDSGMEAEFGSGGIFTGYGKIGESSRVGLAVAGSSLVTEGVRGVLRGVEGIEIVGEIRNVNEVMEVVRESGARVLFMDSVMMGEDLEGVLEELGGMEREVKTVLLVHDADEMYIKNCIGNGVNGFLSAVSGKNDFIKAIFTVIKNGIWIDNLLFDRVLRSFTRPNEKKYNNSSLTGREAEVLKLVKKGMSNKQISSHLGVSLNTVKNHLRNIYEKLEVNSRYQIIGSNKIQ